MLRNRKRCAAFTLIEIVVALAILATVISSIFVVMNHCIAATIDSRTKMEAFALARENMENLLASDSVKEMAEFGTSETNQFIQWQTVVETFYEPITSRMWIQAVCSANYTDSSGQEQTIELTHWLTDVTQKQMMDILEQVRKEREFFAEMALEQPGGVEDPGKRAGPTRRASLDPSNIEEHLQELESNLQWLGFTPEEIEKKKKQVRQLLEQHTQ